MSIGRAAWTATRETLARQDVPSSSPVAPASSNADLQGSLRDSGELSAAEPVAPAGLTPTQVSLLGTFGIGPENLDDEAQRRMAHGLSRLESMQACAAGDPTACESMGPGPVRYTTGEGADPRQQTVVIEEEDYRLTLWSETDPSTGQEVRHLLYEDVDGTYISGKSDAPFETVAASEAAHEPEKAPEPEREEGIDSFLEGAVLGDF